MENDAGLAEAKKKKKGNQRQRKFLHSRAALKFHPSTFRSGVKIISNKENDKM